MNPLIQFKILSPLFLVAVLLACFGLSPAAQAVVPPPDGGYPNFTTAAGDHALQALTSGVGNTAVGTFSLFSVTTGNFNTAVGAGALDLNQADSNTATGAAALLFNTLGGGNTAMGAAALEFNEFGQFNTATGAFALYSNTGQADANILGNEGSGNTANGYNALRGNTVGHDNTANGAAALVSNVIGSNNTADGANALSANLGSQNTAIGKEALLSNTTGSGNTAIGMDALAGNTTGGFNIALGFDAGTDVTIADHVIAIGSAGADVSNTTWIGNVYGVTTQSGTTAPVIVSDTGQLGTVASSERFKKDIANMDKTSEAILSLRPVKFHYKTDTRETPQFGLIAEEVTKVNPALVLPDKEGKPYTVRYDAVNAMLLNEFLKEHRKVERQGQKIQEQEAVIAKLKTAATKQEAVNAEQQKRMEALTASLKEQAAQIQKVSAQIELSKSTPQTVLNNQ